MIDRLAGLDETTDVEDDGNTDDWLRKKETLENLPVPGFLYQDGNRLLTKRGDEDVTADYQDFLRSVNAEANALPTFLYESDGLIYLGVVDDTDVTEEWKDWIVRDLNFAKS